EVVAAGGREGHRQGIAVAGLAEGQVGEGGDAVHHRHGGGAAQCRTARVVAQGDGHAAAVDRIPLGVVDLDGQAERAAYGDGRGRLGGDRQVVGGLQLVIGEGGDQQVGHGGTQPGGQVVAGPGGVAIAAVEDVVEIGGGERVERRQGLGVAGQGGT